MGSKLGALQLQYIEYNCIFENSSAGMRKMEEMKSTRAHRNTIQYLMLFLFNNSLNFRF
ncbi:hypothetical protein T09_2523 [Trichinella sp. T9]|nr:hypothetical protein T09_2523 [Trichinella sp. T9]